MNNKELNEKITIIFKVGGVFMIDDEAWVQHLHNVTIAGQTAHSVGGLNLRVKEQTAQSDNSHQRWFPIWDVSNVSIRYLSAKGGFKQWTDGQGESNNKARAFAIVGFHNLIIDHFSGGYGSYSLGISDPNSSGRLGNLTVQKSLFIEGVSGHNVGNASINSAADFSSIASFDTNSDPQTWWGNAWLGVGHRQNGNVNGGKSNVVHHTKNLIDGFDTRTTSIFSSGKTIIEDQIINPGVWTEKKDLIRLVYDRNDEDGLPLSYHAFQQVYLNNIEYDGSIPSDHWELVSINGDVPSNYNSEPIGGYKNGEQPPKDYQLITRPDNLVEVPSISINDVKDFVLKNSGAGIRFNTDGTPYNIIWEDVQRINLARGTASNTGIPSNVNLPSIPRSLTYGEKGEDDINTLGSISRLKYPTLSNQSRSMNTFEMTHGFPQEWASLHSLGTGSNVHNETKVNWTGLNGIYTVINNAGYTNLEIYLAELAGDFYMLSSSGTLPVEDVVLEGLSIYPIPTKDKQLYITNVKEEALQLTIYDTTGRLVYKEKLMKSTNTVDLNNLAKGVYFLKIVSGSTTLIKNVKFILN